jgi:hypothetical protein
MTSDRVRDGNNRFVPGRDTPERDAQAFEMKSMGKTLGEIAIALKYVDGSHVSKALRRHLERRVAPAADEYRAQLDARRERMRRECWRVLEAAHYKVNNGIVVHYTDCDCKPYATDCAHSKPLLDDSPVLAAIDRLRKLDEDERRLYGLDAPVKHDVSVSSVTVKVQGADDV